MLISYPFLTESTHKDDSGTIRYAFGGHYPVNSFMEWHNGIHLNAPVDGDKGYAPLRAMADGKVIYIVAPDAKPSTNANHAQNYWAYSEGHPEWTDKGMVIIEHTAEIGAREDKPVSFTFYSVYMHLKTLDVKPGQRVYRKDRIGEAGQIYSEPAHVHVEICMDEANLTTLLGQAPDALPALEKAPTRHGRTDVVFGSTYVYLPAGTPVHATRPATNIGTAKGATLSAPLWVKLDYKGDAHLTTYHATGEHAGEVIGILAEAKAEYDLADKADKLHKSLNASQQAQSSPSAWYEVLRFGRVLGPDPLPEGAEHWRCIHTPQGLVWANLSAPGTFQFSYADFPAIMGWQCISDDHKPLDQRCDSETLRTLFALQQPKLTDRELALKPTDEGMRKLASPILTPSDRFANKLKHLICKFPSEFDQGNFEDRYGYIKDLPYYKDDTSGDSWKALMAHIKALTRTDLPEAYKNAQWHFHPIAFIQHMRKSMWLSEGEFKQLLPSHAVRSVKVKDADGQEHPRVLWEGVTGWDKASTGRTNTLVHRIPLNRTLCKYGLNTPLRMAAFFGNAVQETSWLSSFSENGASNKYYTPWHGRGFLQLTNPANYFDYWRFRGRKVDSALGARLQAAFDDMYKHKVKQALRLLKDENFPEIPQQIKDWRDDLLGSPDNSRLDSLHAPSDSAGWYAVKNQLQEYADAPHALERILVNTTDLKGNPTGNHVYYRSNSFWQVSASVNRPNVRTRSDYSGLNGFDSRCSAYGVALAVLTEMRFPDAKSKPTNEYPEGYTPRRVSK
jgi:predicted chitinase